MAEIGLPDLQFDAQGMYQEEVFTDRRIGTIRRLTPVDLEGARDATRNILFIGQGQIMTPLGTIPLSFEIDATDLGEAIEKYPAGMKQAVDETMEEMKELRRQAASSIVLPESGALGGGAPGGLPGGGKLKLP